VFFKPMKEFYSDMRLLTVIQILLIILLLEGCKSEHRNSELTLRNDIQDEDFNQIVIDQIQTPARRHPERYTLAPGQELSLPHSKVIKFRVSRAYKDHSKLYEVTCPPKKPPGSIIKLIDIHLNRMSAGCILTKAGQARGGLTTWQ